MIRKSKIKNKRIMLYLLLIIVIFFISIFNNYSYAQSTKPLNNPIDVPKDIYVQHDENNSDLYLLKEEGEFTIVYQLMNNIKYTAGKQWTRDGLYINDETNKVGATAPEDYVSVKEGEVYFVKLYGIGDIYKDANGNTHITTPIVYFDDNDNCTGYDLSSTYSSSKSGVEITIPSGTTKMYISNYNNQSISIQKKISLNKEDFEKIKNEQEKILNYVETNYENVQIDPIIYNELDKGYITFVNDDSRPSVDQFADLFISKNAPLCLAAVGENLLNTASNLKETRLEVALRVQQAGGEILAHNAPVITEETINDNNFMYNYFVVQKQLLTGMGLNVNGIILAGGNGQISGSPLTAKWASALYKYSDLLGENSNTQFGIGSVYYYPRRGLSLYNNDVEKIKEEIDKAIENRTWTVFYFHDENEISVETMKAVLDYINSKSNVEIATYNTMYQKFAIRESDVKNDKKTYYVSSTGTSTDGTDKNDPTNLEILNSKKLKSGDTVLFKSGDTFFGTLNLSIANINNNYVTISNYGEGDLPTISSYKYINNGWEKYSDNIYRIDIKDTQNYTGYTNDDTSAFNVGFLEDDRGNKYYDKKVSIEALSNPYDFYSDGSQYLYMYINTNPYEEIGNLKVVVRSNLMHLSSNMKISNLRFSYSGGHALEGSSTDEENIIINNCIIENIGGSYLYSSSLTNDTRYGNGIEFYGSNARNIEITNNIFRNIYDVAFTIQGPSGSGTNIFVHDNVFINNSQDSEIWESENATGVYNYQFNNNLSINQGRGWGYEARIDKYPAASILFWGYELENTDISFENNVLYNPRQIYYLSIATDKYFLSHDTIKSDNNTYYMAEDSTIYRNAWNYGTKDEFISTYNVDRNSIYYSINPDIVITEKANTLNNINQLRLLVLNKEDVIDSIELANDLEILEIRKGNTIDLDNIYLKINYCDGSSDNIKLDKTMLSSIDYERIGTQTITVSYLGYKTQFNIEIIEDNIEEDSSVTENKPSNSANESNKDNSTNQSINKDIVTSKDNNLSGKTTIKNINTGKNQVVEIDRTNNNSTTSTTNNSTDEDKTTEQIDTSQIFQAEISAKEDVYKSINMNIIFILILIMGIILIIPFRRKRHE